MKYAPYTMTKGMKIWCKFKKLTSQIFTRFPFLCQNLPHRHTFSVSFSKLPDFHYFLLSFSKFARFSQNWIPEAFSSGHTKIVDFAHFYWFRQFLLISAAHGPYTFISSAQGCGHRRVHPDIKIFAMGVPVGGPNVLISSPFLLIWCKNIDMKSTFLASYGRPRPWAAEINRFCRVHPEINKNCPNQ